MLFTSQSILFNTVNERSLLIGAYWSINSTGVLLNLCSCKDCDAMQYAVWLNVCVSINAGVQLEGSGLFYTSQHVYIVGFNTFRGVTDESVQNEALNP